MMQTTIEPTAKLTFALRRMRDDDLPAVVDFFNAVDALEPMENNLTLAEFKEDYHWPDNQEIYTLAHAANPNGSEGRLIGYLECDKEDDTDMAWGELLVHPADRNNGVGWALYQEFERLVLPKQPASLHFAPKKQATLLRDFFKHYAAQQRSVPNYGERLRCYQCYIALDALRFFAKVGRHDYYQRAKSRILTLLG